MSAVSDVEKWVLNVMDLRRIPGLAMAILCNREVAYANGFGTTSTEDGGSVTPHTLFRIGSVTKLLTAALIMRLVQADRLDLDAPIRHLSRGLG